jgi:Kef-type K+ transport system membrane component KefB
MEIDREHIVVVVAIAAAAPLLADLGARFLVPVVVVEMLLGIVAGPEVLGIGRPDGLIESLSTFGLGFLFFLAGYEIDFERIRGTPIARGTLGWALSLALGLACAGLLWIVGLIDAPILVALALTTTALGTLMPILRDSGILPTRLGALVVGAGAVGEFGPVVVVSIILALEAGEAWRTSLLLVFAVLSVVAVMVAGRARPRRIVRLAETTMHTSGQFAIRLTILVLVGLGVLASELGLDVILGAFVAGVVVGLATRDQAERPAFEAKLDAVGYGFLIPVFFVATGMDFDLGALTPSAIALVPGFALLFLLCRGLPAMTLYRQQAEPAERRSLALLSAAALPLVVAITEIGTETGVMREDEAVALVAAGMLSVLAFPMLALAIRR